MERTAQCSCGALRVWCTGEPVRRSVCHCDACRRRTGSALSFNITFLAEQVTAEGESRTYRRQADSGRTCSYQFCPACGATVLYTIEARPGMVTVPAGAFGQAGGFEPAVSVTDARRDDWLVLKPTGRLEIE